LSNSFTCCSPPLGQLPGFADPHLCALVETPLENQFRMMTVHRFWQFFAARYLVLHVPLPFSLDVSEPPPRNHHPCYCEILPNTERRKNFFSKKKKKKNKNKQTKKQKSDVQKKRVTLQEIPASISNPQDGHVEGASALGRKGFIQTTTQASLCKQNTTYSQNQKTTNLVTTVFIEKTTKKEENYLEFIIEHVLQ
jgi:hypothetical protein